MKFEIIDEGTPDFTNQPNHAWREESDVRLEPLRLGEILLTYNLITQAQLDDALAYSERRHTRLGKAFIEMGFLTQDQINWALANHLKIPYVELTPEMIDQNLVQHIPEKVLRQYLLIPLVQLDNELTIAMADPTDTQAIADLTNITRCKIKVALASQAAIQKCLEAVFCPESVSDLSTKPQPGSEEFSSLAFLNRHLLQACSQGAEEIHFDPAADSLRIRYRIKGILVEQERVSRALHYPILSRLKLLGNLRIEENLFQRSSFTTRIFDTLSSIHLSILPTSQGETMVLKLCFPERVFSHSPPAMESSLLMSIRLLLQKESGLLLVTGPGITENVTTLYTLLAEVPRFQSKKVITIEQTQLFRYPEVHQICLDRFPGLTYATAVDHALAQHPDLLLVDQFALLPKREASLLLHAALSGTLVLGATELYDTFQALEFLRQHLQAPSLLSTTLLGILARSTLRQLCPHCKERETNPEPLREEGLSEEETGNATAQKEWYREGGCAACQYTGFSDPKTLYEWLEMRDPLRQGLLKNVTPEELHALIRSTNRTTLYTQAWQMAMKGEVSFTEVRRKTRA